MKNIEFQFTVNRWANFYFFVQNLSEWHFSNILQYNEIWRQELGTFSKEEELCLKKFKKIRFEYGFKGIFEKAFFYQIIPLEH